MCDMYGHGFYWQEQGEYKVLFDFETNSHCTIRKNREIPEGALPCGFDPIDGTACSNCEELPTKVRDKIEMMFQAYFPDKESIIEWICANYGKNDDVAKWEERLFFMLSPQGLGALLGIEGCKQTANHFQVKDVEYLKSAEVYTEISKEYAIEGAKEAEKWCIIEAKRYTKQGRYYAMLSNLLLSAESAERVESAPYSMTYLDAFCEAFRKYPNAYWAERTEGRKLGKKSFVVV